MNLLVLPAEDEIPNLSKRLSWHDREGVVPSEIPPFPMYTSAERDTALLLCGWNFGPNGQNLEDYLKRWGGRREEGRREEGGREEGERKEGEREEEGGRRGEDLEQVAC